MSFSRSSLFSSSSSFSIRRIFADEDGDFSCSPGLAPPSSERTAEPDPQKDIEKSIDTRNEIFSITADGSKRDKELLPGRVFCLLGSKRETKNNPNTTGKEKEHTSTYSLNQVNRLVSCGRDPARSLPLWRGFLLIRSSSCALRLRRKCARSVRPQTGAIPTR
jgi:hypothetical protein